MSVRDFFHRRSKVESSVLKEAIRRYTGDSALRFALDPSAPERQEREIISVVTRVRDFESLFAGATLANVGQIMNRYYAVIAETMMHSEGDVSEFCGPTIVAHFGLHRQVKDVTMMLGAVSSEFSAAASSLESEFGVHIGMGMCRGTVLYGNFGSSNRIAYRAFGPPILCAERSATLDGGLNVCELLARSVSFAGPRADAGISVQPHWEPQAPT